MMIRLKRLPARSWIALFLFAVWGMDSHAVGLGPLQLQSWLGQPLRANVRLLGADADSISGSCIKARLESSDGVFLAILQTTLTREPQSAAIHLLSQQAMHEPAMTISVVIDCGTQVNRIYQILLDPPVTMPTLAERSRSEPAIPAPGVNQADAALATKLPLRQSATPPEPTVGSDGRASPARQQSRAPQRSARRSAMPILRPVLRLSGDDPISLFNLKLTTTLSTSALEVNPKVSEEMRAAQARFAALIRNTDPLHDAEVQARSARERIQILQAEVAVLREQGQINQAKLEELRKKSDFSPWIAGLAGLVLASLGALIWLAWRQRTNAKSGQRNWWENSHTIDQDGPETGNSGPSKIGADPDPASPLAAAKIPAAANQPAATKEINFIEKRLEPRSADSAENPAPSRAAIRDDGYPFRRFAAEKGASVRPDLGRIEIAKLEEISDVLQEVEFWMLLNDRERVLEILEPLSNTAKPDSQVPWLYLLDTYREMQDQEKYDALRERYSKFFNVSIARWDDNELEQELRSLEDFPHVVQQICDRWHHIDIVAFLESLLIDDRDGTREGFDLPVYRDLMMLISLAKGLQKSAAPSAAAA